jgi:hypothetical protein
LVVSGCVVSAFAELKMPKGAEMAVMVAGQRKHWRLRSICSDELALFIGQPPGIGDWLLSPAKTF